MVTYNWWGIHIRASHEQTQSLLRLLGSGAAIDGFLLALGIKPSIAAIVGAALVLAALWVAASDDGNGVGLHVTWTGWLWVENPP